LGESSRDLYQGIKEGLPQDVWAHSKVLFVTVKEEYPVSVVYEYNAACLNS